MSSIIIKKDKMKKVILLPISLMMLLATVFVACEKDSEDVCERFDTPTTCSIDATYCANDSYGYYLYNDKKYTCTDDDCEDAINQILQDAECVVASTNSLKSATINDTKIFMQDVAKRVMAEARAAAGCN